MSVGTSGARLKGSVDQLRHIRSAQQKVIQQKNDQCIKALKTADYIV